MKKRDELYYILKEYLSGGYTTEVFADVMYDAFYPDRPFDALSEIEFIEFEKLAKTVSRFSRYEADFINYPDVYVSADELFAKAVETYENLTQKTAHTGHTGDG